MNSARTHWASIGEAGALSGLKFMFLVYRWFGRTPFRVLLYPVILYFFLFRRGARNSSLQYLRYLQEAGLYQPRYSRLYDSYRHFLSFGESLLDKLAVWQGDIGIDAIHFHQHEVIERLASERRGAVLMGSHLGNLEVCRALVQLNAQLKMNVLMHTANAARFNHMLKKAGRDSQMNIIQVTDITPATAMLLQQKIDQGEYIVIAGDRIPLIDGKNTSRVRFLGHDCDFPSGAFVLASILRCPLLSIFCLRREQDKIPAWDLHLDMLAERIILPRQQRPQQVQHYCQVWADMLGRYCQLAPLQWYNFYPFWQPSAAAHKPTP